MQGKIVLYLRATQPSLSQVLPEAQAQLDSTARSWEGGTSGSPMRKKHQSGARDDGRNDPYLNATQLTNTP